MDYRPLAKPSSAQEVLEVRSKRVRRESREMCVLIMGHARGRTPDRPVGTTRSTETAPPESDALRAPLSVKGALGQDVWQGVFDSRHHVNCCGPLVPRSFVVGSRSSRKYAEKAARPGRPAFW